MLSGLNAPLRRLPTWVVYLGGAIPALWLVFGVFNLQYSWIANTLGADPLARLEHETGIWALRFLIAALAVTPILRLLRLNLVKFRRALGLLAFFYVVLHLAVWVWLDHWFAWGTLWGEILKRPFITVGMAAFVMLVPLALTSNNAALRRLGGATWRRVHWWAYPATLLGAVHFLLVVKRWPPEPLIYLGIVVVLLAWRLRPKGGARSRAGQDRQAA